MYIAFEEVTNQEEKKNKKIRRDPSLVIWLDIYCPQNKMFVFLLWYVQLSLPSPKSKSRSVFNQNGFNGKNETTHCSNKKSARNSCNLPLRPPTLFSYILLLLRKPWNTTIENRTNLYLTYWCFSVKMKETLWKKTDNKLDLYEAVETLCLFISATSRLLPLFSCWSIFAIYQAGFFGKKGN